MHGRKASSSKDDKAKLEKVKELIPLVNHLIKKKNEKIYDKEYIEKTSLILRRCPNVQTLWNFRKEYFESLVNTSAPVGEVGKGDEEADCPKHLPHEELKTLMKNENTMVEEIMVKFNKCNDLWFHKLWIIKFGLKNDLMDFSDLMNELEYCKRNFNKDDRNFHCWNYRSYIIACVHIYMKWAKNGKAHIGEAQSGKSSTDESDSSSAQLANQFDVHKSNYELSKTLIERNFSNFSAWFLKYTIRESLICTENELDLIKNAIFTDPFDQSMWEFYRWFLFHKGNDKEEIFFTLLQNNCIYFFFQNLVKANLSKSKCYDDKGREITGEWGKHLVDLNNPHESFESYVYFFKPTDENILLNGQSTYLKFCIFYYKYNLHEPGEVHYGKNVLRDLTVCHDFLSEEDKYEHNIVYPIDLRNFSQNEHFKILLDYDRQGGADAKMDSKSSCVSSFTPLYKYISRSNILLNTAKHMNFASLNLELEQINELLLLESNCKFALFTKLEMLRRLEQFDELFPLLELLKQVDSMRIGYYKDLETELRIQKKVHDYYEDSKMGDKGTLDLSGLNIDNITYPLMIEAFFIPSINLSNNLLSESYTGKCTVNFLYNLRELNLSHNKIKRLVVLMKNLYNLKLLEKLDVSSNALANLDEDLDNYSFVLLPNLKQINISDSNLSALLNQRYKNMSELNTYKVVQDGSKVILSKE
ncbi:Protein prenyltransferase alpha subunit [Plasmodium coatneyi]|uniref:Geranylgeranyl transferase type-2 subunit alpha n=1 Tax=Plasmodium coatneyi TaxID=208452 RepID=A0A1B1E369_9APIC|nr:Protein prenyltransferase alpha subunit [Plasmodium coatneyi]ANQ09462.1 Protein prenyltransferase alpha subunit [Plasmodium coatneyi]